MNYRNYNNVNKVENTYKKMLENQNIDFLDTMKKKYLPKKKNTIFGIL